MLFVPLRQGNNNPAVSSVLHCGGVDINGLEKQIPRVQKHVKTQGFGEILQLKKAKKQKLLN